MKITEVENLSEHLKGAKLIGMGTTCFVFLMRDGRAIKMYINTPRKVRLFDSKNMLEHLEYLNTLNNGVYIGPDELLMKNGEIIAYIMDYRKMKTLARINAFTRLSDIEEHYKALKEGTIAISEKKYRLRDLHNKNILFGKDGFAVIDLDSGKNYISSEKMDLYRANMGDLNRIIIDTMFGAGPSERIRFFDSYLQDEYDLVTAKGCDNFYKVTNMIKEKVKDNNPNILELRLKGLFILDKSYDENYYRRF